MHEQKPRASGQQSTPLRNERCSQYTIHDPWGFGHNTCKRKAQVQLLVGYILGDLPYYERYCWQHNAMRLKPSREEELRDERRAERVRIRLERERKYRRRRESEEAACAGMDDPVKEIAKLKAFYERFAGAMTVAKPAISADGTLTTPKRRRFRGP